MSKPESEDKVLREAFSAGAGEGRAASPCPGDEEIWSAARGELAPEQTRALLAHSLKCADCKQSWLAASVLAEESRLAENRAERGSGDENVAGSGAPPAEKSAQVVPFRPRLRHVMAVGGAVAATLLIMFLMPTMLNLEEAPIAPTALSERIHTELWRVGESRPLAAGDRLQTGDRIYLTLESDLPVHLYLINEDQTGEPAALFPVAGAQWSNPLPAGESHRLPGGIDWQHDSWEVSSAGGRESFTVIAALEPLPELESALAMLHAAAPPEEILRGAEAAVPDEPAQAGRAATALDEVLARLRRESEGGAVMVHEIVLDNPGSIDQ